MGNPVQALEVLDAVTALDPGYLDAHVCKGNALLALGRTAEADAAYRTALSIEPDYPYALNGLGLCAEAAGQGSEALAFFERALASDAGFAEAQHNRTRILTILDNTASALDAAHDAHASSPTDPTALINLGIACGNEGRFEEALGHLSEAIRIDPDNGFAVLCLAKACGAMQRFAEAEKYGFRAAALGQPEGRQIAHMAKSMRGR